MRRIIFPFSEYNVKIFDIIGKNERKSHTHSELLAINKRLIQHKLDRFLTRSLMFKDNKNIEDNGNFSH